VVFPIDQEDASNTKCHPEKRNWRHSLVEKTPRNQSRDRRGEIEQADNFSRGRPTYEKVKKPDGAKR
jgi:hypothetical protein